MCRSTRIAWVLTALLSLVACARTPEAPKDPAILKISPESAAAESWRAHDVVFVATCDLDISSELPDTPWATLVSSELTGNGRTEITIHIEDNLGAEPRTGALVVKSGSKSVSASFSQMPLGDKPGIRNYDGKGAELLFDALLHQSSVRRYHDGNYDVRMLSMSEGKFLIIKGIPANSKPGDKFAARILQNWLSEIPNQQEKEIEVVRVETQRIWLADDTTVYIFRK